MQQRAPRPLPPSLSRVGDLLGSTVTAYYIPAARMAEKQLKLEHGTLTDPSHYSALDSTAQLIAFPLLPEYYLFLLSLVPMDE